MVKRVGIIPGSTRPHANSPAFAQWVSDLCQQRQAVQYELVHISTYELPLLDEPGVPAVSKPTHEHTKRWQRQIAALDGFIFVTPQYNWGYPAALKNVLDYLYSEWNNKPALVVTYGGRGGTKCQEQLMTVLQGLRMQPVFLGPAITITRSHQAGGMTVDDVRATYHDFYSGEISFGLDQLEGVLAPEIEASCMDHVI